MDKEILNDKKLLTRFILKLRILPDTPALIQFIAGDEDYLRLCNRIVNATDDRSRELKLLRDVCLKQEFDFHFLKERLTPVARAFGLAEDESSYYELLGVARDADPDRIKKAFRKRVIEVQISASGQEFINLKTAYQILGDPSLRRKYDKTLQDVHLWKEKADHLSRIRTFRGFNSQNFQEADQNPSARTKVYYQLGGLFLLLIIVIFIFDFIYRQTTILDDDYSVKQKPMQEQKLTKAAMEQDSVPKNEKKSSKANALPEKIDNSHIQKQPLTGDY